MIGSNTCVLAHRETGRPMLIALPEILRCCRRSGMHRKRKRILSVRWRLHAGSNQSSMNCARRLTRRGSGAIRASGMRPAIFWLRRTAVHRRLRHVRSERDQGVARRVGFLILYLATGVAPLYSPTSTNSSSGRGRRAII